ncbi:MAG: aminopeptidase [Deferribacteres bacterium]|nr:aminopeptidase [candidate division KSB1 bacterium]MCB9510537.1 aminopeptidase [Deferribacteres bacterium]
MKDPRHQQLAQVLINHSTRLQKGERILIEAIDVPHDLVVELIRQARDGGGVPFVTLKSNEVSRALVSALPEQGFKSWGQFEAARMQEMDAYIGIRGSHNIAEMSDVSSSQLGFYKSHFLKPVHFDIRVPKTKWVVLRYPTSSMAQQAGMSTEAFEDFYFRVCTLDYGKMSERMQVLQKRMQAADHVKITGQNTHLEFSIKDIPAIPCGGEHNIPDGECFTAPVRDSVNGYIQYNAATIYEGVAFNNIRLEFENGKVINATGDKTERLNEILDTDEGARYVGEFAIGFNPHITTPMLDILFDEKIAGSFHFTPGQAYELADNGNRSKVHWDMVMLQTPEYGGGEIYFDGELIRKDGMFVPEDLQPLNPKNLI